MAENVKRAAQCGRAVWDVCGLCVCVCMTIISVCFADV
jgi:hypothetical protein